MELDIFNPTVAERLVANVFEHLYQNKRLSFLDTTVNTSVSCEKSTKWYGTPYTFKKTPCWLKHLPRPRCSACRIHRGRVRWAGQTEMTQRCWPSSHRSDWTRRPNSLLTFLLSPPLIARSSTRTSSDTSPSRTLQRKRRSSWLMHLSGMRSKRAVRSSVRGQWGSITSTWLELVWSPTFSTANRSVSQILDNSLVSWRSSTIVPGRCRSLPGLLVFYGGSTRPHSGVSWHQPLSRRIQKSMIRSNIICIHG